MAMAQSTGIQDLSAPEAYVLVNGAPSPSRRFGTGDGAFELAILELVGCGWLATRESPDDLSSQSGQPDVRFIRGRRSGVPENRPLFAAYRLFDEGFSAGWAPDDGLPGFALWQGLGKRYGSLSGYTRMEVLPSLRSRDLYERGSGLIGMLTRGGWRRTQSGVRLQKELQELLYEARDSFPVWTREDPGKALDFLERSGAALLLTPSLYSEVSEVARLSETHVGSMKSSPGLDPQSFGLLAALSETLDRMGRRRKGDSDVSGGGTGFGGLGGLGGLGGGGGDGGAAGGGS